MQHQRTRATGYHAISHPWQSNPVALLETNQYHQVELSHNNSINPPPNQHTNPPAKKRVPSQSSTGNQPSPQIELSTPWIELSSPAIRSHYNATKKSSQNQLMSEPSRAPVTYIPPTYFCIQCTPMYKPRMYLWDQSLGHDNFHHQITLPLLPAPPPAQ